MLPGRFGYNEPRKVLKSKREMLRRMREYGKLGGRPKKDSREKNK
jgi:hypothetical protein